MAVTLPSIDISFVQRATSLIERSERGIAVLIVRDATKTTPDFYSYRTLADVSPADFTAENYKYICDVYALKQPYTLCVVRIGSSGTVADAVKIIEANISTGWVTIAGGTSEDFTALVAQAGTWEGQARTFKVIVHGITTAPDKKHVVDFVNETVTFADERGEVDGEQYLPSLLGLLAGSNVQSGVTYARCGNLVSASAIEDPDGEVGAGKFILLTDWDGVYVGVGVNSLTTTNGSTATEDMKYIETVEAMDLIADDIRAEFRDNYVGKYKNSCDNQMLFISAIREYLRQLAQDNILDPDFVNTVTVDVAAQRAAWVGSGTAEAVEWSDEQVIHTPFKRTVFLAADIKILGSMEHLTFEINMQ